MIRSSSPVITLIVLFVAGCADATTPVASPLAGLTEVTVDDTTIAPPPPPPAAGPGSFRGVVRGYQTGIVDTLGTAELLAGVTVTAYTFVAAAPDGVGPQAASVVTNASGEFQLPVLPGGAYVVTFTPAAGSPYRGGWTMGTAGPTSNDTPWWIMLPRK